jgi:hypothetical protein
MGAQARNRLSHDIEASARQNDGDVDGRSVLVELRARERDRLNVVPESSEGGRELPFVLGARDEARGDDDGSKGSNPLVRSRLSNHLRLLGVRTVNVSSMATSADPWY